MFEERKKTHPRKPKKLRLFPWLRAKFFVEFVKASFNALHAFIQLVHSLIGCAFKTINALINRLKPCIQFLTKRVSLKDAGSDQTGDNGNQHGNGEDDELFDRLAIIAFAVVPYDFDLSLSFRQIDSHIFNFLLQLTKFGIDGCAPNTLLKAKF